RDLWTGWFPSRPSGSVDRRNRGFQCGGGSGGRRGLVALGGCGPLRAAGIGFGLDGGQNFFAAFLLFVHSFVYTLLANILLWKRPNLCTPTGKPGGRQPKSLTAALHWWRRVTGGCGTTSRRVGLGPAQR